jgi:membrane protein
MATAQIEGSMRGWRGLYRAGLRIVKRTILSVLEHDCLNVAQSCAYSAIVALFPALIVAAAVIELLPDTARVRVQIAEFFDRILPPDVSPLLSAYFENSPRHTHSARAMVLAAVVSVWGAANVIGRLMEGFRRAYEMPRGFWSWRERRLRALVLVPVSMVPMTVASLLVMFGHFVTVWLAGLVPNETTSVYVLALVIRWAVALGASVGLIALIFYIGTPEHRARTSDTPKESADTRQRLSWSRALPGAIVATLMWFLTTLAFGLYVTRYANYSEVYGSLGAGIALLFWLYIVSLSVLCGAEFNAQLRAQISGRDGAAGSQANCDAPDAEGG